jgi:hypothetical protein
MPNYALLSAFTMFAIISIIGNPAFGQSYK